MKNIMFVLLALLLFACEENTDKSLDAIQEIQETEVNEAEEAFDVWNNKRGRMCALDDVINMIYDLQKSMKTVESILDNFDAQYNDLMKQYNDLMKQLEICPSCGQDLDGEAKEVLLGNKR